MAPGHPFGIAGLRGRVAEWTAATASPSTQSQVDLDWRVPACSDTHVRDKWTAQGTSVGVVAALVASVGCQSLDARVRKIVDEEFSRHQTSRQDTGPARSATNTDHSPADTSVTRRGAAESQESEALASMRFLDHLDELLSRLKPDLPPQLDDSVLRCLTQQQTDSDRNLRGAKEGMMQQKREREKYRANVNTTYYRAFLPIHARIDYAWRNSTYVNACVCFDGTATTPEDDPKKGRPYFVFDGECDYSNCRSGAVSKVYKKPIFAYAFDYFPKGPSGPTYSWLSDMTTPRPPLLMRLIDEINLEVPARLYCEVHEVAAKRDVVTITCRHTPGQALSIVAHGDPAGTLSLNAGDLISIPLANTVRGTDGVLRKDRTTWLAEADISAIAVRSAATCPTRDAIIASVPKPKRIVSSEEEDE